MTVARQIQRAARSLESAVPLILDQGIDRTEAMVRAAIERGYFTPEEDESLRLAFHEYLTARAVIRSTIEELRPWIVRRDVLTTELQLRAFAVAYAAATVLVRAGHAIVTRLADHPVTRRKLDEPDHERGIPRKQFTRVYRSLTSHRNAWSLRWARQFARDHRSELAALRGDPVYAPMVDIIEASESALDISLARYLKGRLRFTGYRWRRRQKAAFRTAMFGLFEGSGRILANLRLPGYRKRVNATVVGRLAQILEPGDVLVTRHHDAASNFFLPGYWPHAALHIGTEEQRIALGIEVNEAHARSWTGAIRILEARRDGVLYRLLEDTLSVDAVVVIRPILSAEELRCALERAIVHEGKLFDFAFDFFRADRVVCTEVVYRAFDGIGDIRFQLQERAGRFTLSAEDLLDCALDGRGFRPIALFGTPETRRRVVYEDAVREPLIKSYRNR